MESDTALKINELARSLKEKRLAMNMEEAIKMAKRIVLGDETKKVEGKTVNELFKEEGMMNDIKEDIKEIKEERENMEIKEEEQIADIKEDLAELKKQGEEISEDMEKLKENVSEVKHEVEEEKADMDSLSKDVEEVDEIKKRIKEEE